MASLVSMVGRLWGAFDPPKSPKSSDALKFGVLGAANIAPLALITPAKSHPEVIVQAVSARDRKKAEAFAKAHGIPEVRDSYEDILNDPNIDCIFIPLPNALHYEWAVRAIRAGKHVLLEKPSVSNSIEAESLFNLPELSKPDGPVLLEAFHSRFYPSWSYFRSLINPADVVHVSAYSMIPWWGTGKNDIHFNYALSGGSMMAMGTYNMATLRLIFGAEPEECLSCDTNAYTDGIHDKCDYEVKAKFRFPNGGIGEAETTLKGPTYWTPSHVTVTNKEVVVPDDTIPTAQEKVLSRELTLHGFIHGVFWHRIDIKNVYTIRNKEGGAVIKKWEEKTFHKAYTFREAGGQFADLPGETFWMSYRHQLEQFVNRVKGRKTQHWVSAEDSIGQMRMLDMAYEKSGLGPRPTSKYRVEDS
ncbi:hypothetical protein AJ80_03305 [Polytolypa hystricis UAMH7299]|uniref:D-xylose 1-dehydrogenase (NADP(+), D-xylono-1,5-lactone-forming) n=1 Tax=Polytolypa hystricis (strain UAMH7299) TaxID=1447883 RepID=A0A2B7YKM9_POLH7|nr:hypothetical protein AJ80_03305 [Polytolypa hystricis UAMH7299]